MNGKRKLWVGLILMLALALCFCLQASATAETIYIAMQGDSVLAPGSQYTITSFGGTESVVITPDVIQHLSATPTLVTVNGGTESYYIRTYAEKVDITFPSIGSAAGSNLYYADPLWISPVDSECWMNSEMVGTFSIPAGAKATALSGTVSVTFTRNESAIYWLTHDFDGNHPSTLVKDVAYTAQKRIIPGTGHQSTTSVYNGKEYSFPAAALLPQEFQYTVLYNGSTTKPKDVGEYNITILVTGESTDNIEVTMTAKHTIQQRVIDGSPVLGADLEKFYDGAEFEFPYPSVLPQDVQYTVLFNGSTTKPKDVGVYTITLAVTGESTDNIEVTGAMTLTIKQRVIDGSAALGGGETLVYNGQPRVIDVDFSKLPFDDPCFSQGYSRLFNGGTAFPEDAGDYIITLAVTGEKETNIVVTGSKLVTITPFPIAAADISFYPLTYSGGPQAPIISAIGSNLNSSSVVSMATSALNIASVTNCDDTVVVSLKPGVTNFTYDNGTVANPMLKADPAISPKVQTLTHVYKSSLPISLTLADLFTSNSSYFSLNEADGSFTTITVDGNAFTGDASTLTAGFHTLKLSNYVANPTSVNRNYLTPSD